jgi:DNA helicase-2/ATP-dependent DNA helicase PcrA
LAITRAKHELYLTHHRFDEKGKEQVHLRFLSDAGGEEKSAQKETEINISQAIERAAGEYGAEKLVELQQEIRRHQPCSEDEKHLLKGVLQNYRLSVTHLVNFLNVIEGGPHLFLEKNLLRFPQMMSPNAVFGSAMHKALANFYLAYKQEKKLPSAEFLKKQFDEALRLGRLNRNDFKKKLAEGLDHLQCFYDSRSAAIDPQDKVEVSFITQQVVVNGAMLNGQIDRMHVDPSRNEIVVFDYKTGKTFDTWEPTDEYAQIKAWQNRLQLVFYKILVENSREYRGKTVHKGVLEFLKPKDKEMLSLELEIATEESERLKKLIGVVYQKIMTLDFPDISRYDKDLFGIGHFTDDLLNGRV